MVDGLVGDLYTAYFQTPATSGETFTVASSVTTKPDGSAWTPTITHLGNGKYQLTVTTDQTGLWGYLVTGDTSGAVVSDAFYVATALDPSLLHSAPIMSAMALINGDDYQAVDGKALIFSLENVTDLTGATVTLTIAKGNTALISQAGTVANPGAATQTVTVELTKTQTATLPVGAQSCGYDLAAVLANGHTVTLARGRVTVTADVP